MKSNYARVAASILGLVITLIISMSPGISATASTDAHTSVHSLIQPGSPIHGVFEGTTPCDDIPRPLPQMPENIDCEQMTWKLTLNQDPATGTATTFKLNAAYGLAQQGTQNIQGGGTKIEMEGRWARTKGTRTDLEAVVYRLNPDNLASSVSFLKLDDYVLHVLGRDKGLMIGNGGWSYTLHRTDTARSQTSPRNTHPTSPAATVPLPTGSATLGVFDGRTPCNDIALQFTGFPASDCNRIKWRLTLYQDPDTGAPTTYKYQGTQGNREGIWRIARGTAANPEAIVYQLAPDKPQQSASFLKADDNILLLLDRNANLLIGDDYLSYTLNRIDDPVSTCFSETGQCLRGIFWRYWETKGGPALFGFPISLQLIEDGRTVQYTEKARLEWHPENQGTEYEVLLGRLGTEIAEARAALGERPFRRVARPADGSVKYFPETGHTLVAPLRAYWEGNGGLAVFGYPLSEAFQERSATDGNTYLVQYFERNRLEYHPEHRGTPNEVMLGLLGAQEYQRRYNP